MPDLLILGAMMSLMYIVFAILGLGLGQAFSHPSAKPFALMWLTFSCTSLALYPSMFPLFWLGSVALAHGLLLPSPLRSLRFSLLPIALPLAIMAVFPPARLWSVLCIFAAGLFALSFAHNLWIVMNPQCDTPLHS